MGRLAAAWSAFRGKGPTVADEAHQLVAEYEREQRSEHSIDASLMAAGATTRTVRSDQLLLETFNAVPRVRQVLDKISQAVAGTEWFAVEAKNLETIQRIQSINKADEPRRFVAEFKKALTSGDLKRVPSAGIMLINEPNPLMTSHQLRKCSQVHLDLPGRTFLWLKREADAEGVERPDGEPVQMFCLPPSWLNRSPSKDRQTYDFRGDGFDLIEEPAANIIHIRHVDPASPMVGASGIGRSIGDEADVDELASKTALYRFGNHGVPEGILHVEGNKTDGIELERKWYQRFGGWRRVGVPVVTSAKVTYTPTSAKWADLEVVKLREFQSAIIREAYGVPPEIFGIVENSNRATIAQANIIMAAHVTIPRLNFWFDVYNSEAYRGQFDNQERILYMYESPNPEDWDFILDVAKAAPWSRSMDEWRTLQDLPPKGGPQGELHAMPFNLVLAPIGATNTSEDEKAVEPIEVLLGERYQRVGEPVMIEVPMPIDTRISEADIDGIVEAGITDEPFEEELDESWKEETAALIALFLLNTKLKVDQEVIDAIVAAELKTFTARRIRFVHAHTKDLVRATLTEGIKNGESLAQLTKRVQEEVFGLKEVRAASIASTEVNRAAGASSVELMTKAGVKIKVWITRLDPDVRDQHESMHGQRRPMDVKFTSPSGARAQHPGDFHVAALDIGCRCKTMPGRKAKKEAEQHGGPLDADETTMAQDVLRALEAVEVPWMEQTRKQSVKAFEAQARNLIRALSIKSKREAKKNPSDASEVAGGNGHNRLRDDASTF